jgi:intracellular sulfur oxidation DsrE/DsrF family protein
MTLVIILNRDQMGPGEDGLGRKILTTFLRKAVAFGDKLEAIVLYNAGVKLAAKDSPVAAELAQFHENGVEVLPCTTCVEHFGLMGKLIVDKPCSMDEIITTLRRAEKVITL